MSYVSLQKIPSFNLNNGIKYCVTSDGIGDAPRDAGRPRMVCLITSDAISQI